MSRTKLRLYNRAVRLCRQFCDANALPQPLIKAVRKEDWVVEACAFYRPDIETEKAYTLPGHVRGINVCLDLCPHPCDDEQSRNWSWPASSVDRTPFGVVCHELGHHADWCVSKKKGRYFGNCSIALHKLACLKYGEAGLTTYADTNQAEYFAEAFRLYVTNPSLLAELRPATCKLLLMRFRPLPNGAYHWRKNLGPDCPTRVVKSLENKGAAKLDPKLEGKLWTRTN